MIGQRVHYVSHGTPIKPDGSQAFPATCRAAVITEQSTLDDLHVGLMVINPTGLFFHSIADGGCHYENEAGPRRGGTWHWPEDGDR